MSSISVSSDLALRANIYHAMARAFARPAEWEPGMPQVWRELARGEVGLEDLAASVASSAETVLEHLESAAVAHAKLFLGPFEVLAPPYASVYLEPDQQLMGPVSTQAAEAYAEAGVGPAEGPREAPDHIGHELEFMYYLAYQETTSLESIWSKRQRRFWRDHLGHWLPALATNMVRADAHPYYRVLGEFLLAFCDSESKTLSSAV